MRHPSRIGVIDDCRLSPEATAAAILPAVGEAQRIVRGFPSTVRDDAQVVADLLPTTIHSMSERTEPVVVQGERIEVPYRIYNPQLPASASQRLTEPQQVIAACVYSRHHNGFARETAARALVGRPEAWVVPYVVQLLGEYVAEIHALILDALVSHSLFGADRYRDFVRANASFMALTEQRAISYWSCYYRREFRRDEYPALVALRRLIQTEGS